MSRVAMRLAELGAQAAEHEGRRPKASRATRVLPVGGLQPPTPQAAGLSKNLLGFRKNDSVRQPLGACASCRLPAGRHT